MNNLKNQEENDFGINKNKKSYECSRPHNDNTANDNEALDEQFTGGEDPDTNLRYQQNAMKNETSELIESGLNLAENNTPYPERDSTNPYDSYNLDHEDEAYHNNNEENYSDDRFKNNQNSSDSEYATD